MSNLQTRGYRRQFLQVVSVVMAALTGAAVLTTTVAHAQDTTTIRDVALQAIETNPEVQANWHAFRAAAEDVSVARGGYLPSVDLTAAAGKASRDYDGRGSYDSGQAGISLSQMLFDGFRTSSQVNRFDSARLVRYFELLNSVETIALEAVAAYEDVQRQRQLVVLARDNYAKHRDVLSQIEERVTSGVGRRVDLEQVAGRLALAESNLLTEASNLHDVTARYLRIVGKLPAAELAPTQLEDHSLPPNVQEALYLAYQGNPGFHAAIKNIAAAQAAVKVERAGYYPKAELRARQNIGRNTNGFDDRFDPDRYGAESAIELAITYNLYSGGSNRAAVRRSLEQVNQAKDLRDLACINLRQTTQIAYNDSRRIAEQLISLDQHRRSSDKVRIAYSEQFNIGQRTLLDLLDAENEYFQASRAYVNALSDNALARARTLAAMGKLLPALGIVRDGLEMFEQVDADPVKVDADSACPTDAPVAMSRADLITEMTPISNDALFATGRSDLSPGAAQRLDQLLQHIKQTAKVVEIRIEGHTDNTGSDMINIPLSKARAETVRNYLVLNGLETANIQVEGYGASRPVADNLTDIGRTKNRRVEVTVSREP